MRPVISVTGESLEIRNVSLRQQSDWTGVAEIESHVRYDASMTLFFYGPNRYALIQQVKQMVRTYTTKAGSDLGLERIDGATISIRDLVTSLQAVPFLANSRLVIVEGLAGNKAVADHMDGLFGSIPQSTVALFIEKEADQRTKSFKELMKADKVIKFEQLSGLRLINWVRSEANRTGGEMDASVARQLVDRAGEDQWRLSEEISKLVSHSPKVNIEAVRELVTPGTERSIFELVEAMSEGDQEVALRYYRDLLEQRVSEIYILTMIQWHLRNLLLAKTAPPGMSPGELAATAGLSPYVAAKAAVAQARLSLETLSRSFAEAADAEFAIKTGRLKADVAVERLIYMVGMTVRNQ